jgi:AraC-like DNA-binding protein
MILQEIKLDGEFISKTVNIIEKNISNSEFNANILCRELGISKRLLYIRLKNFEGQTVNEFIRNIRLKRSAMLLSEGRLNITNISIETGFNSNSYFTRSFKKYYGMSPKAYKDNKRINHLINV